MVPGTGPGTGVMDEFVPTVAVIKWSPLKKGTPPFYFPTFCTTGTGNLPAWMSSSPPYMRRTR